MDVDYSEYKQDSLTWIPPILPTVSTTGEGIQELINQVSAHKTYLLESGEWKIREAARLKNDLENLLGAELRKHWESSISEDQYNKVLSNVLSPENITWQSC